MIMRGLLVVALSTFASLVMALDNGFETLETPLPTSVVEGQIEVVELFWYGCPHCYDLEPTLESWVGAKPDNVVFVRIPAIFRKAWVPAAKAYYTAELLGVADQLHAALFNAVHVDGGHLHSMAEIEALFVAEGVSAETFRAEYDSFAVDRKIRAAIKATRDYRITGVPSIIVNGKYRTTASLAGGTNEAMLAVVDQLISQELPLVAGTEAETPVVLAE